MAGDDVLEERKATSVVWDLDQAREHARHRHHAIAQPRTGRSGAESHGQVQGLVAQVGERVPRVQRDGRQDREYLAPEVLVHERRRARRQLLQAEEPHTRALEIGQHVPEQRAVLAPDHLVAPKADEVQLLARRKRVGSRFLDVPGQLRFQARDADHEEFVEVAAGDGEELEAFQRGHGGVARLFEHPLVECDPGQLAVDEPARIGQRLHRSGGLGRRHYRQRRHEARPLGRRGGDCRDRCRCAVHTRTVHARSDVGE